MSVDLGARPWDQLFARHVAGDTGDQITAILNQSGATDAITLSGGFPHPETFPTQAIAESFPRVLEQSVALQYSPTAGLPGLRDWFAGWLGAQEGVRPAENELCITSGGMEGIGLISRCVLDPGDRVVVEGPTFFGALVGFQRTMTQVEAVPVDDDGLDVSALERLLATSSGPVPKIVYVIPDFQNPSGLSMSVERRHALVALARRHGILIVEDVAYRELGFDGERRPSLWALGPDVVAQVGTFAKTFAPGIRMGWVAAPAELVGQLLRAKQNTDQCTGALGQLLLEDYGRSGRFDQGIAFSRKFYRERRDIMVDALRTHLPEDMTFTRPLGGFFSWITAPAHLDTVALQKQALDEKVTYVPGAAFYPDGRGQNQLRLAYSRVPDEKITEGVRKLASVLTRAGGA
ncbi:PLP-dependent aminotransferase family protein [Streptomyces sp. DSM 41527]|uniref:PLP-dependent aminotransferase family protein n=1 Tax=Streptomyces mooreae TaxID=3075523 RepID=A0ABU2T8K2_9ACTN|nr:PLP-dependent aminotransferase family protein [Streptomyces sp. DSM 41527]MDT0457255.1 PLP-dependent aminotransferase family protein [Streptomyces sp. DSM 41527]